MSDLRGRLEWLDSLRGIAVLGVVLVHTGQAAISTGLLVHLTAAGQYGVQLFFIISAVTISLTYRQHIVKYGHMPNHKLAWLTRRVFRIWPLYAVAGVVYSIVLLIQDALRGESTSPRVVGFDLLVNLIFIHPWFPSATNSVPPGGWSIGVEVTFYAIFPVLMTGRKKPYSMAMLVLLAVSFLMISEIVNRQLFGTFSITDNSYLYYWPPTQLPVILIGCVFFLRFFDENSRVQQTDPWVVTVLFCILMAGGLVLGNWGKVSPGLSPSVFGLAFCCLAIIAASDRVAFLTNRWMSNLGICSYSIYLVHFGIIDIVRLLLNVLGIHRSHTGLMFLISLYIPIVVVSYCIAKLTRRLIELPGIEIGRKVSLRLMSVKTATAGPTR